jgi:hypothetical protein
MKMMDLLYNIKEIESTMEVGGSGPPRRQLIIVNLKLEYLRIVAGFFMSSTSLKLVYANGIIRFAHEPFVGGLQKISNLSNFVAGFFMSSTSLKLVYANGIIRFAHEPFVGGLQRILNLRNFVAGFFMSQPHSSWCMLGLFALLMNPLWEASRILNELRCWFFHVLNLTQLVYAGFRFDEPFVGGLQRILKPTSLLVFSRELGSVSDMKKPTKFFRGFLSFGRRVRDSNPRTCYSQQFSRLPQSTHSANSPGAKVLFFSLHKIFFLISLHYFQTQRL